MNDCESNISKPTFYFSHSPRLVYKATREGKDVIVKDKENGYDELEKEAQRTQAALKLLGAKIRIPKVACIDKKSSKLVLQYFPDTTNLEVVLDKHYRGEKG